MTKNDFTEKEKKAVKAEFILITAIIIINVIFLFTIIYFNYNGSIDSSYLFISSGIFAVGITAALAYTILFFIALKNIKARFKRYIITAALVITFGILYFIRGIPCFTDIFCGTKEVITNNYSFFSTVDSDFLCFTNDSGHSVYVQISDEQRNILWDNPYDKEADSLIDPYGGGIRQNYVIISYYPHTEILADVDVEI